MLFLRISFFLCLLILTGCSRPPSEAIVKSDFLGENPTWMVISVGVGEGDSSAAYYHIKYVRQSGGQVYEEVWQYLNEGDGGWKVAHKEPAKPSKK